MAHDKNDLNDLRQQVEAAKRGLPLSLDQLNPDTIQTLLHELQVHQIELELQNEELRRIQAELEAARRKYTALYEFAPVGYFTLNQAGMIEEVNLAGAALLEAEKGDLIHHAFSDRVHPDDQDTYYLTQRRLLESPALLSSDVRLVRSDGSFFQGHLICLVVQDSETQNRYRLMMVTDITEQKREEQAAVLLAASHERERLARDLHDAVSQSLFASLIIAEALPRLWERSPERAYAELVRLQQLNRGALAEMRTLLLDLRPETVLETEFETLLNQLGMALQSQRDITVAIQVPPHLSLPPQVKVVLYRITQEALNNVAKYAQSHQVTIRLVQELAQLELCIMDDGQGFDPNNVSTGFGLKIMQERAEAIGATLNITSQLKEGTSVTVVWPLS